ncbi:uncharacterized protein FOMMEDRAFT_159307 [Fomitiporia mediterranea MF3/22]|uniref:uncharacterized protein n=1 Tax=Fomitiporia mediterranea (strain MF3/22) TaxID=694068 RepID=UPI0004408D6B|nr:uncharacterized protein FOMMEDRAFT_159307 [Fomitiporia mediterranea MF3/22]EJD00568.1 hypothetical protein FOMMEDRAFT_159307 [Fomitiporia mediterranea MF3/22]
MGCYCIVNYVHDSLHFAEARHHYGDPEGCGTDLVATVPTDEDEYKEWLEKQKDFYASELERLNELEEELGEVDEEDIKPYLQMPGFECYRSGLWPNYEYEYTIDLSEERFSVGNAHFPLWNIPRGDDGKAWIKYLDPDSHGICLRPDTPSQHCHRVPLMLQPVSEAGLAAYRTVALSVKTINESTWMPHRDGKLSMVLSSTIIRALMMYHYTDMQSKFLVEGDDAEPLQTYAQLLLCAASPAGFMLSSLPADPYLGDPVRRPPRAFYRYRGCIIFVTLDCSTLEQLQSNIGLTIEHARENRTDDCTFIIFSIHHIAIAMISGAVTGALHVSHSNIILFFAAFGFEGLETGLHLIAHYLRPHCIDGGVITIIPFDVLI